jgi:hypothetical protein
MIGVLSMVPGTRTWRRCNPATVAAVMPVAALVALGLDRVNPNMGQSVSRRAVCAGAGVLLAFGTVWGTAGPPVAPLRCEPQDSAASAAEALMTSFTPRANDMANDASNRPPRAGRP